MLTITSIFNPVNWIKFTKDPKKGFEVLKKIICDYPRIQKLLKIKNKFLRKQIINFYNFFVSHNKSLKFFFLEKHNICEKIYFNKNDLDFSIDQVYDSLAYNGIVFIQNVLSSSEEEKILSFFNEIESQELKSKWINNEIINASNIKYKEDKNVNIKLAKKNIGELPELNILSNNISKKIFGKSVNTSAEFYLHHCKKNESNRSYTDTIFHIDRYLPCLKIIYSPEKIDENHGPFGFVKTTHKLNNKIFKKIIENNNSENYVNELEMKVIIDSMAIKATCDENTLIIAFTNGLHKRNIFLNENIKRKTIFFQYTENFNRISLFNFLKYNSK